MTEEIKQLSVEISKLKMYDVDKVSEMIHAAFKLWKDNVAGTKVDMEYLIRQKHELTELRQISVDKAVKIKQQIAKFKNNKSLNKFKLQELEQNLELAKSEQVVLERKIAEVKIEIKVLHYKINEQEPVKMKSCILKTIAHRHGREEHNIIIEEATKLLLNETK